VIPVKEKDAPADFDAKVRTPGNNWLREQGIPPEGPKPKGVVLDPFWTHCLPDLYREYEGICAYLCIYFEKVLGAASVDHFVAKSPKPGLAYEWSNFRLACLGENRRKGVKDVLDPFTLKPDTFQLELVTGRIYPGDSLSPEEKAAAEDTIEKLGLDDPDCRAFRVRRFTDYLALRGPLTSEEAEKQLRRYSPFIWYEAQRQGLL